MAVAYATRVECGICHLRPQPMCHDAGDPVPGGGAESRAYIDPGSSFTRPTNSAALQACSIDRSLCEPRGDGLRRLVASARFGLGRPYAVGASIASLLCPGYRRVGARSRAMVGGLAYRPLCQSGVLRGLLAESGPLLGEPYTKQLDGKLGELRFHLKRQSVRITYWIASDRRIILLTVFYRSRTRNEREVERACRALARCIDEARSAEGEGG
jgi:Phage derived protein Gp49-like (DUF891)